MSLDFQCATFASRVGVAATVTLLALLVPLVAKADGEAGILIQNGNEVTTYCVAFEGDSISGEQALRAAGRTFEQFGGGARTLCAIDNVGCFDPSSFNGCFCQCPGGPDCTYWAFFVQPYGQGYWTYSTAAFNTARLRDGDMHAYKWGEGSPNSAPSPVGVSFEQVCGHAPRGGVEPPPAETTAPPQPTSAETPPPAATDTTTPASTASAAVSPPSVTATEGTFTPLPTSSPAVSITLRPTGTATSGGAASARDDGDDGGSNTATLVAFGAVAGTLAAAAAGAVIWRRSHGA